MSRFIEQAAGTSHVTVMLGYLIDWIRMAGAGIGWDLEGRPPDEQYDFHAREHGDDAKKKDEDEGDDAGPYTGILYALQLNADATADLLLLEGIHGEPTITVSLLLSRPGE